MNQDNSSRQKSLLILILKQILEEALNEKSVDKYALRAFVISRLMQFNLYGKYDYQEILIESVRRVRHNIESSNAIIYNMPSYIRGTVLNIVRECQRKEERSYQLQKKLSYMSSEEYFDKELSDIPPEILLQLKAAWRDLSLRYRIIVYDRAVKNYTFREIADELRIMGLGTSSNHQAVNTISRQYHRAISRLRSRINQF